MSERYLCKYLCLKGRITGNAALNITVEKYIKNCRTIDQRSAIVKERWRLGDLEIDSIIDQNRKRALMTINNRFTGRLWIRKLKERDLKTITDLAIKYLSSFKGKIFTITSDNGFEFAFYKEIETKQRFNSCFVRTYHSWERGSNENTNGLIRLKALTL